jgi:hypothetical protein
MAAKPILLFKDLASKITGFSTPFFGMSWQPPETERKIAKSVVNYLEDRRVLYNPTKLEVSRDCITSVNDIRRFLTAKLDELDPNSELAKNLKMMRSACRKFLDSAQPLEPDRDLSFASRSYSAWVFYGDLGELRGTFGVCLSQILIANGLDIENDLAKILPANYLD